MNELKHYGILGMRWGVRRKSGTDGRVGSAKQAPKKNPKSMSDEELASGVKRMTLEKTYATLSKNSGGSSKLEKSKKVVDATSQLVNQAKSLNRETINAKPRTKLNLDNMTDQQLRDRINRTNLERQYNDMFGDNSVTVSRGRAFATKALDVGGQVLAVGGSSLAIALAIKELRK
jgi:hypothetical protein